jgi:hypothetical protein
MHFKGKCSFLTPTSPTTIHQKEIKIGMVHYVCEFNECAKFQLATFTGFAPAFLFFFVILGSRTARTKRSIFMVGGSNRVFWRKEVPFGGLVKI